MRFASHDSLHKAVKIWLIIGLLMIFIQIIIGGVTRLTGSGLSITKWEIITGTIPPLSEKVWQEEFVTYQRTPQYKKINEGMSLRQFKFIYFWEYFHRLWARTMGFVFLFPFLWFLVRGMLSKSLIRKLGTVVLLAAVVASVGWIMVASGLIDRPWVNAYKLSIHLSLALILYGYLFWTTLTTFKVKQKVIHNNMLKTTLLCMFLLLCAQIFMGGVVSGMKAAMAYPTWPDMNGYLAPPDLLESGNWNVDNFVNYDGTTFMSTFIQFFHRLFAYLLVINVLGYIILCFKHNIWIVLRSINILLVSVLITQILLGILTVVNSIGHIPVLWGVLHQGGAIVLLSVILYLHFIVKKERR